MGDWFGLGWNGLTTSRKPGRAIPQESSPEQTARKVAARGMKLRTAQARVMPVARHGVGVPSSLSTHSDRVALGVHVDRHAAESRTGDTNSDWGTLADGGVNYGWGLIKVVRGASSVLLGATASVLGVTPPAGAATMAYGAYDMTTGLIKATKGVRQVCTAFVGGVPRDENGWRPNAARFLWGTVPGGALFDEKTDWLDKWGSLP